MNRYLSIFSFVFLTMSFALAEFSVGQESNKERKAPLVAPLVSVYFGGRDHHEVELDGYGTCHRAHWVSPVFKGGLAAANPFVSPAVPEYYSRHGAPIAYVRGSKPRINARFRAPEGSQAGVEVTGEVRAEFNLGVTEPVAYRARLSGTVKLYLLRQPPAEGLPLLHTPVDLGCRAAAGLDDDALIIDAVWKPFAAGHVTRARDGLPLAYYGTYQSTAGDLRGLLVSGSGQCTTWAYLQHCALGTLGIESEITGVFPAIGKGRILVANWTFLEGTKFITSGPNGVLDTEPAEDDAILDESEALKLAGEDFPYLPKVNIWPLEGVGGQQSTNPPPDFPNHVILCVGGVLYDPSYGTGPFPDHATWEKASLIGVGTGIRDADSKPINRGKVRREGKLSGAQRMLSPD